jgi:hypothetical protein
MLRNKKLVTFVVSLTLSCVVGLSFAADNKPARAHAARKANARYVINGGEIYDQKTDLTWSRCSVGQHWQAGNGCVGVIKEFTFGDALKLADANWRVPDKDELATLIDYARLKRNQPPMIDAAAFPDMDPAKLVYWSSTPDDAFHAWNVDFHNGGIHYGDGGYRENPSAVRLVRSGK